MKKATIYHNPKCSKSRAALEMLKEQGIAPEIILYLENPPSAETIKKLLTEMKMSARDLLRTNETPYKTYHLENKDLSDDHLIEYMVQAPILMNRPIVVTEKGARLGRPLESILEIL